MPRPTRAFGLGDIGTGQLVSSPYICRSCRHLALRQHLAHRQSLRYASSKEIPFTEKIRRKIWGTDNPPGLADPYGGESFFERRRKERALQKEAHEPKELEEEHAPPATVERHGGTLRPIDEDADSDYVHKEYVPAETWDGLEHVGHKGHWQDIPPKPEDMFDAFLAQGRFKASKPEHFLAAIHQSMVEIFTLQQAGKDLNLSTLAKTLWYPEIQELLARTQIEIRPGKISPKLTYPTENTKDIIIGWFLKIQRDIQKEAGAIATDLNDSSTISEANEGEANPASEILDADGTISNTAKTAEDSVYDAAEIEQAIVAEDEKLAERQRPEFEAQYGHDNKFEFTDTLLPFYEGVEAPSLDTNQTYLDMKLDFKDELTYFLFRRITQLTGFRIPDPVLARARTLRSIYIYQLGAIKPRPKNLAETLATKTELASLPNVKIMGRRETPVDKEKAVGRWKVIEAELRSRGLPVLGRAEA